MKIQIENTEEFKVLHLSGEINSATSEEMDIFFKENISDTDQVKIDFEGVSLITSSAVRGLMKLERSLKRWGSLVFVNVPDSVYQIFEMTGLTHVFNIEGDYGKSEATALKSANDGQGGVDSTLKIEFSKATIEGGVTEEIPEEVNEIINSENVEKVLLGNNSREIGYMLCDNDDCEVKVYYIFINPEERRKGYATQALKQFGSYLNDSGISGISLMGISQEENHRLAERAGYKMLRDKSYIIRYTVSQIADSKLYSKIDKLRPMFNDVHFINELEAVQRIGMEVNYGINVDELDPVFARVYVQNGEILGVLDAREKSAGGIFVSDISVAQKKEAEMSIVLMFASMFDASYLMLSPENEISIFAKKHAMVKAFEAILGNPAQMIERCVYKREI